MKATVLMCVVAMVCVSAQGAYINAEPDSFAENAAMPDNIGVKLRNASYPPGHSAFNESWRRIRAKTPDAFPPISASTGSKVLGNDYSSNFNGYDYGLRAWFVASDNTPAPTNYISFDICWPDTLTYSEGVHVQVWANNTEGVESRVVSQVLKPQSSPTYFDLFQVGITRASVVCWDDPAYIRQKYFTLDDFRFVDQSGTAYNSEVGMVITAPGGMEVGAADSLRGTGTVEGDVTNSGLVQPGNSPGTLTVDGGYVQTTDGELLIELAGAAVNEFDVLSVTGHAALAGTLRVELDGYVPFWGDEFMIMEYASYVGKFEDVIVPDGMQVDIAYNAPGGLMMTVVPEPTSLVLLATGVMAMIRRRR